MNHNKMSEEHLQQKPRLKPKFQNPLSEKKLGLFLHKRGDIWDVRYSISPVPNSSGKFPQSRSGGFKTRTKPQIKTIIEMLLKN
jgi:hypothetical protein